MYLKYLCEKLDDDRPGWRLDSIFQLDGAGYHKSASTQLVLKQLQVSYIVSGPYSFDCSPIELYFSRFKYGELNPEKVRMIKSKYLIYY
jgi:hypothetical protein